MAYRRTQSLTDTAKLVPADEHTWRDETRPLVGGDGLETDAVDAAAVDEELPAGSSSTLRRSRSFNSLVKESPAKPSAIAAAMASRRSLPIHTARHVTTAAGAAAPTTSTPSLVGEDAPVARTEVSALVLSELAAATPPDSRPETPTSSGASSAARQEDLVTEETMWGPAGVCTGVAEVLHAEVERALMQAAGTVGPERQEVLQDLYSNVSHKVEEPVKARLGDVNVATYYELLAAFYERRPAFVSTLERHWSQLWSHELFPPVFCLLFFRWLLGSRGPAALGGDRTHGNSWVVLVAGAIRLFWFDVQHATKRFATVYWFIKAAVLSSGRLDHVPDRQLLHLRQLIYRFYCYYDKPEQLRDFIACLSPQDPDTGEPMGVEPGSVPGMALNSREFVRAAIRDIRNVTAGSSLVMIINNLAGLANVPMDVGTSNRLQDTLHEFSAPGGPLFPPRPVRHAAVQTMNALFPAGRRLRYLISILFRLLHPYYWPLSFAHWLHSRSTTCCRTLACNWQRMRQRGHIRGGRTSWFGRRSLTVSEEEVDAGNTPVAPPAVTVWGRVTGIWQYLRGLFTMAVLGPMFDWRHRLPSRLRAWVV